MPAPGQTVTEGLPDRILTFLADHPDTGYRPAELARELLPEWSKSEATIRVGTVIARLARDGRVSRTRTPVDGKPRPITTYSHKSD